MWPETIVSGFFYLAAFTFWVIRLLQPTDKQLFDFVQYFTSNSLGLGLISAFTLSGAYFFGHIAGRLMTDLWQVFRWTLKKLHLNVPKYPPTEADVLLRTLLNPYALAIELH